MNFKIGDKVEVKNQCHGGTRPVGYIGLITGISCGIIWLDHGNGSYESEIELLNNKENKSMNILEKFTIALKSEPEKTFRKTGITNGDDLLTEDGQKIFLSWLLKKNGDVFNAEVANGLLKDVEDKEKK